MDKLKLNKNSKALVIVAHPDDETIWLGGTILKNPAVNWTIFSLCRKNDPDRAPKFHRVCKFYKAKAIMAELEDEGKLGIKASVPIVKKLLLSKLTQTTFDYIFTHGPNGEYGHPRHKGAHRGVTELIKAKKIHAGQILFFNYKIIKEYKLAAANNSDYITKLTLVEFKKKKDVMTDIYGFDPGGIDVGYCTEIEAFKVKKM